MIAAAALVAIAAFSPLRAQESTGSLEGRVVVAGASMAGVTITVTGPALPGSRTALSDARGLFRVAALPVGSYAVQIVHIGHRPVAVLGVTVSLGRTSSIGDIALEATTTATLPPIVITAARPLIDPSGISLGANIPSRTFTALPTGRGFRDVVELAPMVNASALPGDGPNIAGGSGPETAWFVDGVNMTDVMSGATSMDLPHNFVREVEVRSGGYEAEFGRSMGAAVNVVTQSGGNEWHGQLFGFLTNDHLTALPRTAGSSVSRNAFREYDTGGGIGGPLVRDRLWVYAAWDPTVRREVVTVSGLPAPPVTRTTHRMAGKLTWQPTDRSSLQLTVLGDPANGRDLSRASYFDSVANLDAVLGTTHQGGVAVALAGIHEIGPHLHVQATVARLQRKDELVPGATPRAGEPWYIDELTRLIEGGYGTTDRNDARRTTGRAVVTAILGSHTGRAGFEYEDSRLETEQAQDVIARHGETFWEWWQFRKSATLRNRVPTGYLQDAWRVTPRLTLDAGLRWEKQTLSAAAAGVPAQHINNEWQPRIGVVYQLGSLGTQRVFGSIGRFYEQLPLNLSAVYQAPATYSKVFYPADPRVDTAGGEPVIAYLPPVSPTRDLRGQSFDQFSLGWERLLGAGIRLAVEGTVRKLVWAVDDAVNVDSMYQMIGNPGRGNLSFTPRARRRYTGLTLTLDHPDGLHTRWQVSYTLSRAYGNYEGLYDFQTNAPSANTGSVFDIPETFARSTGLLANDRTHSLKASGSWRFDSGLTAGVFATVTSGVPRNEFGATPFGFGYVFLEPRGSNGRTPPLTDINVRLTYALPVQASPLRPILLLDAFHIGNGRAAVALDDTHFWCTDENGAQACPNPGYGQGRFFQSPRSVRLGVMVNF